MCVFYFFVAVCISCVQSSVVVKRHEWNVLVLKLNIAADWITWCGTSMVVWYFEEGGVVLRRGWCGILKRVVWYFEEGGVVLWRGWCGTLKRVQVYCYWSKHWNDLIIFDNTFYKTLKNDVSVSVRILKRFRNTIYVWQVIQSYLII